MKFFESLLLILQDTKLERDIGVAYGFPGTILKKNELIANQDLLEIMGLKVGDQIELNVYTI